MGLFCCVLLLQHQATPVHDNTEVTTQNGQHAPRTRQNRGKGKVHRSRLFNICAPNPAPTHSAHKRRRARPIRVRRLNARQGQAGVVHVRVAAAAAQARLEAPQLVRLQEAGLVDVQHAVQEVDLVRLHLRARTPKSCAVQAPQGSRAVTRLLAAMIGLGSISSGCTCAPAHHMPVLTTPSTFPHLLWRCGSQRYMHQLEMAHLQGPACSTWLRRSVHAHAECMPLEAF